MIYCRFSISWLGPPLLKLINITKKKKDKTDWAIPYTVNIKRVGNVILAVRNMEKSLEFYHNLIGLPIKEQRENWIDLGTGENSLISLHPASKIELHKGSSLENGITVGFLVGDVQSAVEELKSKGVQVYREIIEKDSGKNVIMLDPDEYFVSLFEPISKDKDIQTGGYHGFTPQ